MSHHSDPATAMAALLAELKEYSLQYYNGGDSKVPDAVYDAKLQELQALERQYPELANGSSPTQTVGAAPLATAATMQHLTPMLSLANAFNAEDIRAWAEPILAEFGQVTFYIDPKYDGLALSLGYDAEVLAYATTRGDGTTGDLVTANAAMVESIPQCLLPPARSAVNVRGELYMPRTGFDAYNALALQEGRKPLSNPRNGAAGSIRLNDPSLVQHRPLAFAPYSLSIENTPLTDHREALTWLAGRGFTPPPWARVVVSDIDAIMEAIAELEEVRYTLPMDIDGAVVRVCEYAICERLGARSRTPRWAIAYKYPAQEVLTTVEAIDVQVGRTGAITPVARLTPVQCGGVEVTNATLHNLDHIRRLDIRVGDTVVLRRAGEVVPEIVSVQPRSVELPVWDMPHACPACSAQLARDPGAAVVYCPNGWACPEQLQRALEHFVSRLAFDIEGLAAETIAKLITAELVREPADLFRLKHHGVAVLQVALDTEGSRSISKLLDAIETSRKVQFHRFLYALGIPDVGVSTAKLLARMYGNLSEFMVATPASLRMIPDVGDSMATGIATWLTKAGNLDTMLDPLTAGVEIIDEGPLSSDWHTLITLPRAVAAWRLPGLTLGIMERAVAAGHTWDTWMDPMHSLWAGVKVHRNTLASVRSVGHVLSEELKALQNILHAAPAPSQQTLPLEGQVIVITGSMEHLNRNQARDQLEALGAKVPSSVSKKTTALVAGPGAGSKLTDAQSLNIPIRDEAWLISLLKEYT